MRTPLVVTLALVATIAHAQPRFPPFPIALAVVTEAGVPVVDDAWIDAELAQANTIFAPSGVSFVIRSRRALDPRFAAIETRSDRNALGAELSPTVVNVFVVRSLRDVDDPTQMRRGVHWRPLAIPGAHFVIVSSIAAPDVLAHELGHFFGNPHSSTPNDVMSYDRDGITPPFFEPEEIVRIRRHARRFLERAEIAP
jgi:hypothetical protein